MKNEISLKKFKMLEKVFTQNEIYGNPVFSNSKTTRELLDDGYLEINNNPFKGSLSLTALGHYTYCSNCSYFADKV